MKKILLLGSGELGKEFVISCQRKGQYVVACDSYAGAPAMQVADECEVFSMLDGDALEAVVRKHKPDIIVPEIEAIRTERLYDFEKEGIQVVPSARAVNYTMNRKAIRDLAAKELALRMAVYRSSQNYFCKCYKVPPFGITKAFREEDVPVRASGRILCGVSFRQSGISAASGVAVGFW